LDKKQNLAKDIQPKILADDSSFGCVNVSKEITFK